MKRDVVVLIMLLLCVVSIPSETIAPKVLERNVVDSSKYVISQTEMPIYELITPEVNATYTEAMASSLTPITKISAEETEFGFVINHQNQTFEIDRHDGSIWYADYDKIWNVASGVELPTPEYCKTTVDAWLREKRLLPENAVLKDIGSTNVSAYNPDSTELRSKVIQWHVNYEFMMGDIPIAGETSQISVMIGDNGEMVGFDWKWRDTAPEPYTTSNLFEFESVLDAHAINPEEVVNHRLVYMSDEDAGATLLYPMWEVEIVEEDTIELPGINYVVHLAGTQFKPQVEITTPTHGITMTPGTSITFDCTVIYGTPPYTYQWYSDFDGVLSTSKSFATVSLSEVTKKEFHVPHAISILVRDAEGRGARDCIAVTIEPVEIVTDLDVTIVLASAGVVVLIVSLLLIRRRKAGFVILFLLMMMSAFTFLPVSTASSEATSSVRFAPSAPSGAFDDGVKEVGIEWVGLSYLGGPLPKSEENVEGFYDWMGTTGGYSREFNWGEWSAWEEDFKDVAQNGTDTEWVDAVDIVYYNDHGGPNAVAFTSQHDDTRLLTEEMRLGDGDLETVVFDACSCLASENNAGENVFERWGQTLQGVHQICGFSTVAHNKKTRGTLFGLYLTGIPTVYDPRTIIQSWFRACTETEGSDIRSAVFYASKSPDPFNPQLDDPHNDHAYGFGYVCSDPTPGTFEWYVVVSTSC